MAKKGFYSGHMICSSLNANEKCFRLQIYDAGEANEIFHEHTPKHRISNDNAVSFMKTLIVKYSSLRDSEILRTYINNRGKEPSSIDFIQEHFEYPEPGVFRKYLSGNGIIAWVDEVITPNDFRSKIKE